MGDKDKETRMKIYRLRAGQASEKPVWVCIRRDAEAAGAISFTNPSLRGLLGELAAQGITNPNRAV